MKRVFRHGILVVLVILYGAISAAEYERVKIPLDGSPSKGPVDAKVVIVEFLDYQ